jgi:putative phosphoesterase
MRIGIVSDIHCNAAGLQAAIEAMGQVEELICAGDLIYYYRYDRDVLDVLRQHQARIILGNHEMGFFNAGLAGAEPDQEGLRYLREQPLFLDVELAGKRLLMVHASPYEAEHRYLYGRDLDLGALASVEADYLVVGHTHSRLQQRLGRTLLINPGSAGEASEIRGEIVLSCAVLDTASDEVVFRTLSDPRRPD